MTPIRKVFSQVDFTLLILCAMFIGGGSGAFLGMLSSHTLERTTTIALFIAYEALVITVFVIALSVIIKNRTAKLARLRTLGILSDAASQTDADVLRLANNNLREEAALVYQELHGGQLDAALFVVGLDKIRKTHIGVLLFLMMILIATALHSAIKGDNAALSLSLSVPAAIIAGNFVILNARAKRLRENREKLASGILPTPDSACLLRKPGASGKKFFTTTK